MDIRVSVPIERETVAAHPARAMSAGPGPIARSVMTGKMVRIKIVGAMNTLMKASSDSSLRCLWLRGRVAGKLITSAVKKPVVTERLRNISNTKLRSIKMESPTANRV